MDLGGYHDSVCEPESPNNHEQLTLVGIRTAGVGKQFTFAGCLLIMKQQCYCATIVSDYLSKPWTWACSIYLTQAPGSSEQLSGKERVKLLFNNLTCDGTRLMPVHLCYKRQIEWIEVNIILLVRYLQFLYLYPSVVGIGEKKLTLSLKGENGDKYHALSGAPAPDWDYSHQFSIQICTKCIVTTAHEFSDSAL